jgi:hypothetical protein
VLSIPLDPAILHSAEAVDQMVLEPGAKVIFIGSSDCGNIDSKLHQ